MKNLIERGLNLHPVKPRGKEPLLQAWPEKASSDPGRIAAWSEQYPGCNFGAVASGEICILESDDEGQLRERLSKQIPRTYTVQARPGRPHFYFRQTDATRAAGNMDLPGIFEFKQRNKYVVAEGSIHPKGMRYNCVVDAPIAEMPDWLVVDLVKLREGSGIRMSAPLPTDGKKIGEGGGRHPMLMSQAGKLWDGVKTAEEMFDELNAINLQHCEPPKEAHKVMGMVEWVMKQAPNNPGPKVILAVRPKLEGPRVKRDGGAFQYLLGPHGNDRHGVFGTRRVNAIFGASGAGKTTLAIQMLEAQFKREMFLGRETAGWPYLVLWQDRGEADLEEQLDNLGMSGVPDNFHVITEDERNLGPAEAIRRIYSDHTDARVAFVEGVDLWLDDACHSKDVSNQIHAIRSVAEHHDLSMIVSLGAPKAKAKEGYVAARDRIIGSSTWGRVLSTVCEVKERESDHHRLVTILPRADKSQAVTMEMHGGKLVVSDIQITEVTVGGTKKDAIFTYLSRYPKATTEDLMKAFSPMSRSAAYNWMKSWRESVQVVQ